MDRNRDGVKVALDWCITGAIMGGMPKPKKTPAARAPKASRRSLTLFDLDRRRIEALRKVYAARLDLRVDSITEQTVISWAIRDAARVLGVDPEQGGAS